MDLMVNLGVTPSLHIHASGALTFCSPGLQPPSWDDDMPMLAVEA